MENCTKPHSMMDGASDNPKAMVMGLEGSNNSGTDKNATNHACDHKDHGGKSLSKYERREMKLRNTFGWARIDILAMLIVCIILASLSFSLLVEALQTLVHIDHQDTMHLPIPVMILGFVGLLLNGLTYLLIGGYTMHQGSFLQVTPSGTVVLDRTMSNSVDLALQPEERQLSSAKLAREQRSHDQMLKKQLEDEGVKTNAVQAGSGNGSGMMSGVRRQGASEMLRDISSTIFVIVCAFIVFMAEDEEHTAKFIDPVLSIFSCVLLVSLSYRYMKESCLILLQTIPDSIDMENFENTLVKRFPQIVSYHDLHIWQLAANKYIATVHIQFESPRLYVKAIDEVRCYFHDMGITEVTIQPEFFSQKALSVSALSSATTPSLECLMQCNAPECAEKVCCRDSRSDLREVVSTSPSGGEGGSDGSMGSSNGSDTKQLQHQLQHQHQQQHQHHHKTSLDLKVSQAKNAFIKKLLPHLDKTKSIERSKSTNDLACPHTVEENPTLPTSNQQPTINNGHENGPQQQIQKTMSEVHIDRNAMAGDKNISRDDTDEQPTSQEVDVSIKQNVIENETKNEMPANY